jgi:ketosteroid isomerase-like protein
MPVSDGDRAVVERYCQAMVASSEQEMESLFAEDAVYIEPFSGQMRTHSGKAEILAFFRAAWENEMRAASLAVERLDLDGDRVRSEWKCTIPGLPGPMHGSDSYLLRDGKILRLETSVGTMPGAPD